MLYWDYVNGKITNDKECKIPVYKGQEDIWIESWWVDKRRDLAIDFAYDKTSRDLQIVHLEREACFKRHNINTEINPKALRCITVPKSVYEKAEYDLNH